MTKQWNQEINTDNQILWRNIKNPSITVEAYLKDIIVDESFWYIFTAENGKGQELSPFIRMNKKEAITVIAKLKKEYEDKKYLID